MVDLKKAFSPFTKFKKNTEQTKVQIDLGLISKSLLDESASLPESDDPDSALEALDESAAKIEAILEKAFEEGGKTFVMVDSTDSVEPFIVKACDKKKEVYAEDDEDEEEMKGMKKPKKKADEEDDSTSQGDLDGDGFDDSNEDLDKEISKSFDEDSTDWPTDMSPSDSPTLRSERMVDSEVAVSARSGALESVKKSRKSRDDFFSSGSRCMS